ncbi:MAG TPA: hypothetical protein VLJ80_04655 [Solirubrobacteraceae bacterium]|nr:hypothetical protein [Solirubrobacteraceae bacterium]
MGHEYASSFGPDCTESTHFESPGAVAVDEATHDIYVADQGAAVNSVIKCTASGEEADFTAGSAAGTNRLSGFSFNAGQGDSQIAVAPSSRDFYVADWGHRALKAFHSDGEAALFTRGAAAGTNQISGFVSICGVAVDANGDIYVADGNGAGFRGLIDVFAPSGEELTSLETAGPCNLAVDSDGAVYVDHMDTQSVEMFTPSAFPVTTSTTYPSIGTFVDGGPDYSIALDPLNGDVYVDQRPTAEHSQIVQRDGKGRLLGTFATPGEAGELVSSEGLAVDGSTGVVFVSDRVGERMVRVFDPAAPNPPIVGAASASDVGATSADVQARVNPERFQTHYRFQYLTRSDYQANGASFSGLNVPLETPEAALRNAGTMQTARAHLGGLTPDTTYLFRVVVENANNEGSPVFGDVVPGEEGEFRTFPSLPSGLPDGRSYELVSPPSKSGDVFVPDPSGALGGTCPPPGPPPGECLPGIHSQMAPMQSAADGESIVYGGDPFAAGSSSTANEYLAKRERNGWATQSLSPPLFVNGLQGQGYEAFSPDLSRGVLFQVSPALSPDAPSSGGRSFANLYLRRSDGTVQALLTEPPPNRPPGFVCDLACEEFDVVFGGGNSGTASSPAFAHLIFAANDSLTGATAHAPAAVDGGVRRSSNRPANLNLYEWFGGRLRLVNVQPGDATTSPGAVLGSGILVEPSEDAYPAIDHAISDDGSRVFWSEEAGGQVYVRIAGEKTEEIPDHAGKFLTASADGSKLLLNDGRLYNVDDLAAAPADLTGGHGGFLGILGAAEDLSHVYFVDTEVLTGAEENANRERAVAGKDNLYAYRPDPAHAGQFRTTFIGILLNADNQFKGGKYGAWKPSSADRLAQVTSAGTYLAFMSKARLTGYDNEFGAGGGCPKSEGNACFEVFEYDAESEELACASCNPTGLRPLGMSNLTLIEGLPGLPPVPQPGNLSTDGRGRLFFESQDTLSPHDTNNGTTDVYEWEPKGVGSCDRVAGCVFLISSGHAASDSFLIDSTPSGDDAFIVTRDQLLTRDDNEQLDLYDARVGGGIEEAAAAAPCLGDACQGPPAGPPSSPEPASAVFGGPGNLAGSPVFGSGLKPRPLTRAQKLAKALKACAKRPKKRRPACRARAKRRYGPIRAKAKPRFSKSGGLHRSSAS